MLLTGNIFLVTTQMAFGSWLKGIFGKAKDFITKFAPVVKSVLGVVAPVLGQLGGVLGGTAGSVLSKIGSGMATADRFADRVLSFGRNNGSRSLLHGQSPIVGADGGGIRRITPPFRS